MNKSKMNQAGFGLVEGLLITIIVLLIGFIGYYVWHTQKQASDDLNTSAKSTVVVAKPAVKNVKPVYDQNGVTLYDLSELAQTSDQKQIVSVIREKCYTDTISVDKTVQKSAVIVAGGSKETFTDSSLFANSNGFARLVAGCATKPVQPEDGSAVFILQKNGEKWSILAAGQQISTCSQVDNKQIPSTIVPECYDENTTQSRAPKQ